MRLELVDDLDVDVVGSSPSSRRGFIAARQGACGDDRAGQSSPSSRRGFIAASISPARARLPPSSPVVPVITAGLHCGRGGNGVGYAGTESSSPSSRRGFIAAVSRIGSAGRRGSGRPRHHGGASLRRVSLVHEVLPLPGRPRHHGGASLRQRDRLADDVVDRRRPRHHGGASLRRTVTTQAELDAARRPRHHGGASLRPQSRTNTNDGSDRSSPSSRRGFIAARSRSWPRLSRSRWSSPSSRRGFIAARSARW